MSKKSAANRAGDMDGIEMMVARSPEGLRPTVIQLTNNKENIRKNSSSLHSHKHKQKSSSP